jgi:DNA repair protein SbcC/Rad50
MTDTVSLIQSISGTLSNIESLGDGIYKGQRVFNGRVFATAYLDLSDHVIDRAKNLSEFQEKLIGSDFFNADSEQRWNSYLYFLAGPNSKTDERFTKAKAQIERDRHYARKFVLTEDDLIRRLHSKEDAITTISEDASVKWGELLKNASLGLVLDQYPRTQILESIANGEAFKIEKKNDETTKVRKKDVLSTGFITNLSIGTFRPLLSGREFDFGDVNLIFGQNGAGKTSLLEAIEALYCGRARRDPNALLRNTTAQILTPDGSKIAIKNEHTPAVVKARNLAWYGRSNPQSDAIIHSFTRFNFLDTDAAFRLAGETDPKKIREDLSLLLVGEESGTLWTYLSKLQQEANAKFIGLRDRLPVVLSQTNLLASEVERLKAAPSEANTLLTTFRSNLRKLGGKWLSDDTASLSVNDRIKLEFLYKGFGRAITVSSSSTLKE